MRVEGVGEIRDLDATAYVRCHQEIREGKGTAADKLNNGKAVDYPEELV